MNTFPFYSLRSLDRFDRFANSVLNDVNLNTSSKGYDILQTSDNEFEISLLVPGLADDEVEVTQEERTIRVKACSRQKDSTAEQSPKYLHQGIGAVQIDRSFSLGEHVEAVDAVMDRGVLTIKLERKVPEQLQPKVLKISSAGEQKAA